MSFKKKMDEIAPATVTFLSTDGASINCMVVDDPVLIKGKYRGKDNERIGVPVVTDEGFLLFICGKRVARKLATLEEHFKDHIVNVTRHGSEGDMDTSYDVATIADATMVKRLKALAAKEFTPEALRDAIADAESLTTR